MAMHERRSEEARKRVVLSAALLHAATEGFTDRLLTEAGRDAGVDGAEIARLFPAGVPSLLEFYSHASDEEMVGRLKAIGPAAMKVRERISTAVMTRLEVLEPHKDAACRAAARLGLPPNLPLAARLTYATVDAMWRAAGDVSTDFNFYTKRGILAGVYTSTLMRWFNDSDGAATRVFLAARIENVMQYEKLKASLRREAEQGLDRFAALLRPPRR